jgi:hypothetical protein
MNDWQKSSYSNPSGNCVETQRRKSKMAVRDTKDREGGELVFDAATWMNFVNQIKEG